LFDVDGAVGDFVVEGFDFVGEMDVLRVLRVGLEQGVSLGF
jgi:hypothetical protein